MKIKYPRLIRNLQHSRSYVNQVRRFTTAREKTLVGLCIGIGMTLPFVPPAIKSWRNSSKTANFAKVRSSDTQSANEEDTVA